ncbi:MAG: hypothetical protein ACTTKL_03620 [Treponema sp.]
MNCVLRKINQWTGKLIQTAALTALAATGFIPFSCRMTKEGIKLIRSDEPPAAITDFRVTGKNSARIAFTKNVALENCALSPEIPVSGIEYYSEPSDGNQMPFFADVKFDGDFETGKKYRFGGTAKDSAGNSLSFSLPLEGLNYEIPELEITEVHNRKGTAKDKSVPYPKEEFIEVLVRSDGNLAGLEIFSADKNAAVYAFPAIKVKRKDVIVVHLTNAEEPGAADETGEAINLSKTRWYSSDRARDLWNAGKKSCLAKDCDVVLLRNARDKTILDAFLYAPNAFEDWTNDSMRQAAQDVAVAGKWNGADVQSAAKSDGIVP